MLDATLVAMLALFGYGDAAGLAVPLYRVAQYFLPIPVGFITYLTLRAGPWRIDRSRPLGGLREETAEMMRSGESVYDWADRFGTRTGAPIAAGPVTTDAPPAGGAPSTDAPTPTDPDGPDGIDLAP